ncbi:stromelysin-2 isoform X2 [Acomys russatus]|uniref:stromelysin-2 isoform X2 n=1 Tax=Acomys russatus TaxID=60746 RepID=UPI0021E22634|nr:stromelysin-2 isoform X2 [Acomys russatus]
MGPLLILVVLCLPVCSAYPLNGAVRQDHPGMDLAQQYLEKYYSFKKNVFRRKDSSPVVSKIREMQKFLGLKMTGKLDSSTMDLMHKPRCGVPDVGGFTTFPGSPKWRKNHITYRIVNYTQDLPRESVDSAIERALRVWEEVTPLTFSRMSEGEADIMISFEVGEHGDFLPFDGPGQSLAHAYPPGPGFYGDVHFDDDEKWTLGPSGINLFLTAAHEFGHSLGLYHSDKNESLMYPIYRVSTSAAQFHLSQDDIDGIQSLYGPHPFSDARVVPVSSVSPRPETPAKCDPALSFDAVSTLRGEFLFFKDRYLWRKSRWSPEAELHLISAFWPSLPSSLDAAYEARNKDSVLIFKGGQFWAVRGNEVQAGYPKRIHTLGFPPSVKKIDAAVFEEEKKKTYFFVGDKYWRFDETRHIMDKGFPRLIRDDFPGIEPQVDAVLQAFGYFYFFHGSTQYEFDPNARTVTHMLKSNSWLLC